jgi:AcrR family transcriptional regulator
MTETGAADAAMTTVAPRRRAARKSATERAGEIRDASRQIARTEGLPALTLRSVAARVGVAPALVAHYEPSMDALVAAAFAAVAQEEIAEVAELIAAEPTPTAGLRTLISTLLEPARDDVTTVWADAYSLGRTNDALAGEVRALMDAWQQVVTDVVLDGVAAGEFSTDDPNAVAWQFLGMIDGVNSHALVHYGGAGDRGRLVCRAMENELGLSRGALQS